MTPKEKAEELFNKMYNTDDPMGNYPMCFDTAKQCALIAVDEILKFTYSLKFGNALSDELEYWEEVKQEIGEL
jgi:hypothetical protein